MTILIISIIILALFNGYAVYRIYKMAAGFIDRKFEKVQPIFLLVFGLLFVLIAVIVSIVLYDGTFSEAHSIQAKSIQQVFWITLGFTGFIFVFTQLLLFIFPFLFRNKPGRIASYIKGSIKLEIAWITVPFLTFIFFFVLATTSWENIINIEDEREPLIIEVTGEQFNWRVRYPGKDNILGSYSQQLISESNPFGLNFNDKRSRDDFTSVQLHIPKERPVRIILHAKDVIHSFYIPDLKVKMDAVPGMKTNVNLYAYHSTKEVRNMKNDPGFNYEIACAELCGRLHFAMLMILVVEEEEDFRKWYTQQETLYSEFKSQLKPEA